MTLRIFDDAQVEGTETINLGYSIASGTGVSLHDDNQTQVITITDADAAATTGFNYTSLIGVNSGSNNATSPFNATNLRGRFQFIYLASELRAKGFKAGNINGMSMNINTLGSGGAFVYNGFSISLGHTTSASYASSAFLTASPAATSVYSANYTVTGTGAQTFNFTTPFNWDGINNVLVETCFDNTGGSVAGATDQTNATTTPLGSGLTCLVFSRNTTGGATTLGCSLTAVTGTSTFRPDITFSQPVAPSVPASALVTTTVTLGPLAEVYVYNATGEIQARIKNNTAHDYGCTQVIIDRAGTATTAFWNNSTVNRLLDKTFRVIPTNPNPTGSYDITLYYTATEVTNWQTATAPNTWLGNAKIVKIKEPNQISTITPASPPSQVANIEVNLPSIPSTFGSNYSITATFTTGFSGFGVGNPGTSTLPISLLSFNGRKNNNVVELTWETAFENNNNRFEIETGKQQSNTLNKIGSVNSKGNSNSVQAYGYIDNLPVMGVNYYRLKQVDFDGNFSYSRTIAVTFDKKGKSLTVYPNPTREKLTIGFAEPQDNVIFRIFAADGKEVKRENAGTIQRTYDVDVTRLIPGSYIIEVRMGKEKHTVQFVKE